MSKKAKKVEAAVIDDNPIPHWAVLIREQAKSIEALAYAEDLADCEHAALNIMAHLHDLLWAIKDESKAREMA